MTEYALSTNLYTFAQVTAGQFGWPASQGEGELVRRLRLGDLIVPKFSQSAAYNPDDAAAQDQHKYCESLGLDYGAVLADYDATIGGGAAALPFLIRVVGEAGDTLAPDGSTWAMVPIQREDLTRPISTKEFLRIRAIPETICKQFKATVAPGRHLQEIPDGTVAALRRAVAAADIQPFLRQYTVVEAPTAEDARELLVAAGRTPVKGDRVFIASPGGLLGVHDVDTAAGLIPIGSQIPKSPEDLLALFEDASTKAMANDRFTPRSAIAAAQELRDLLAGPQDLIAIDDFARFHDAYVLLSSKVTQALEIAARPFIASTQDPAAGTDQNSEDAEFDELATLQGLTISAVRQQLPEGIVFDDPVIAECVTALRAGKHILLAGPPGTGKSTLAEALCRAVVGEQYDVTTGTADWTTFDTIGGYIPEQDGLRFEPGVVLRALRRGRWLVIDELNRADIDKAFGPLFTLLAGTANDTDKRKVVLPFLRKGQPIEVRWTEHRTGSTGDEYLVTPTWRLLGTMNISDKAALFQLSFAFLRRFAVIDVPLPPREQYFDHFSRLCDEIPEEQSAPIVSAAIQLAFGARELGPAILNDIATFIQKGTAPTAAGDAAYSDAVSAFLTAVRLYAVPQYEGATRPEIATVSSAIESFWPSGYERERESLEYALKAVALS